MSEISVIRRKVYFYIYIINIFVISKSCWGTHVFPFSWVFKKYTWSTHCAFLNNFSDSGTHEEIYTCSNDSILSKAMRTHVLVISWLFEYPWSSYGAALMYTFIVFVCLAENHFYVYLGLTMHSIILILDGFWNTYGFYSYIWTS
jgi:hypothetical protein